MIRVGDNSTETGGLGVNGDHEALVSPTKDFTKAGIVATVSELNAAGKGVGRVMRPSDISTDFRLRVGIDSVLFNDTFCHAQVNLSKYKVGVSGLACALSGGKWVFNSTNVLTAASFAQMQTWAFFKLYHSYQIFCDFSLNLAVAPQANSVVEAGMFISTGVAAPTDGIFFRYNAAGVLQGIVSNSGAETAVTLSTFTPVPLTQNHYLIVISNDSCEFWIDNVLHGTIKTPAGVGAPTLSMSLPFGVRVYNSAAVTTAQRAEISSVCVSCGDLNSTKLWATSQAIMGNSSINAPDGSLAGQTQNYANSVAPVSAALSNTVAGYATLGGQFQFAAPAGAETDFIIFGYQVPVGAANMPGKNLVIRGVRIEAFVMGAAVATTPTLMQWGIGVGGSAVSLATADSQANVRAPRRLALGVQSLPAGAAIGYAAPAVDVNLDAPIVCEPGCFVCIICRVPVGTATASQLIRGIVSVNGFFE